MKTCLYRPIALNVIAYLIFPQLYQIEPNIDDYIELARFSGTLVVNDLTNNTSTVISNKSLIDLSECAGSHIRITNTTSLGSTFVGEWLLEGSKYQFRLWLVSCKKTWTHEGDIPEDPSWNYQELAEGETFQDYTGVGVEWYAYTIYENGLPTDYLANITWSNVGPENWITPLGNLKNGDAPADARQGGSVVFETRDYEAHADLTLEYDGHSVTYHIVTEYNPYYEAEIRVREYNEFATENFLDSYNTDYNSKQIKLSQLTSINTIINDGYTVAHREYIWGNPLALQEQYDWLTLDSAVKLDESRVDYGWTLTLSMTENGTNESRTGNLIGSYDDGTYETSITFPIVQQNSSTFVSPYTPAFSTAFTMTESGLAGKMIDNGIEIYQTGSITGDESYHFFAYLETLAEGEKYYPATITVEGLPEGYVIQGIRGWDDLTITSDGIYTIPSFTCPKPDMGSTLAYDNKPAFIFASTVPTEVILSNPIIITITNVDFTEYQTVDLGLPSGTLWANKNIGAETEEDAGLYFQWGDTTGYTVDLVGDGEEQKAFELDDYKFSSDPTNLYSYSKYNETDGKILLDLKDDAAHTILGDNYVMPTLEDFKELILNTDSYVVLNDGQLIKGTYREGTAGKITIDFEKGTELKDISGVKFCKKQDNNVFIFIPSAGRVSYKEPYRIGKFVELHSSTLNDTNVFENVYFYSSVNYGGDSKSYRYYGYPVRAIIPGNKQESLVGNTGDILMYDKTNDKKIIIDGTLTTEELQTNYPADSYTPIGVVVIPTSHDVYGDGSCGVMSLKEMDCDTPDTGSTSHLYMYWGDNSIDVSTLPNLNQVPVGNTSNGIPTSQASNAIIPSDRFSGPQCAHDTDAYYYSSSYSYAPSPYLTDGSRNPGYYQTTSPLSISNALADFDGRGNTDKIIAQRGSKDYSSWTPGRITESDYPAASCCDMFHTEGTSQGDWYLPACGELGYMMPPFNKINEAITKILNIYGSSVGITLGTVETYWSSNECSNGRASSVSAGLGIVKCISKIGYNYARAFLKVNDSMLQPKPDSTKIFNKYKDL